MPRTPVPIHVSRVTTPGVGTLGSPLEGGLDGSAERRDGHLEDRPYRVDVPIIRARIDLAALGTATFARQLGCVELGAGEERLLGGGDHDAANVVVAGVQVGQ